MTAFTEANGRAIFKQNLPSHSTDPAHNGVNIHLLKVKIQNALNHLGKRPRIKAMEARYPGEAYGIRF